MSDSNNPFGKLAELKLGQNDAENSNSINDKIAAAEISQVNKTIVHTQVVTDVEIPKPVFSQVKRQPASDVLDIMIREATDKLLAEHNVEALALSRLHDLKSIADLVKRNAVLNGAILSLAETAGITLREHKVVNGQAVATDVPVVSTQSYEDNTIAYISAVLGASYKKAHDVIRENNINIQKLETTVTSLKQTIGSQNQELAANKKKEYPSFTDMPFVICNSAQGTFIALKKVKSAKTGKDIRKYVPVTAFEEAKRWETAADAAAEMQKMLHKNTIEFIAHYRIKRLRTSSEDMELGPDTLAALVEARKAIGG